MYKNSNMLHVDYWAFKIMTPSLWPTIRSTIMYYCCCWYWPPVREVCPNYEVAEFQPWTSTTLDLGSVANCYIHLLKPPRPPLLTYKVLYPQQSSSILTPHRIIRPHGRPLSLSHQTNKTPSPYLTSPVTTITRLFLSSLYLTTPDIFPSTPIPRFCQNIF